MALLLTGLAALALAAWLYLAFGHRRFWRADQRLEPADEMAPADWPAVVAVVPARDEAAVIDRSLGSIVAQDYPGRLAVVLVDDASGDGTGDIARAIARRAVTPVTVVDGRSLPPAWTGKLWALAQGVEAASKTLPDHTYIWLTDADIEHRPGVLRRLVAKAEGDDRHLVSVMARLRCESAWERLLIPAFVFFFQKLYPFPAVNDPAVSTAAAAGGCVLLHRTMLDRAGGIAAVRDKLIDDCALAGRIRDVGGRLWLGFVADVRSLRPYARLADIWDMVARTAYTQLHHSPMLLVGTLLGMALLYLAPPLLTLTLPLHGDWIAGGLGAAAWGTMAILYRPTLQIYGQPARAGLSLPVAGLLYALMTLSSAIRHWRGRGGRWKGRVRTRAAGAGSA